ncbi:MAG: superoxide dismutase family protein [Sulfitobacter sp.]
MKHTVKNVLLSVTIAGALGLGAADATTNPSDVSLNAIVDLKNLDGTSVGMAHLTQTPHGILVQVKVSDLPPGAKGIHLHSMANCSADTSFKSSLGHHGEGEGEHGLLNAQGPGKGDLGNIYVGQDGVGEMQFFKAGAFLDSGDLPLLDRDGTAIVIKRIRMIR